MADNPSFSKRIRYNDLFSFGVDDMARLNPDRHKKLAAIKIAKLDQREFALVPDAINPK